MNVTDYKIGNNDPKYNGKHPCPRCAGEATWDFMDQGVRMIQVSCQECGVFEEEYDKIADQLGI